MSSRDTLKILPEEERLFASAFQYAAIGMALVATDGHWLMVNKALCDLVGYEEEELLSLTFQDITHPDDLNEDLQYVQKMLAGELETYQMEKRYLHKDGSTIFILLSVSLVRDETSKPLFFISQIQNISERKLLESELVRQATEDMLTGVSNRRRFYDLSARELVRGGRYSEPMALLMIDIDHFKKINDTFGHSIGDEALKKMAAACVDILRSVDIFGRIGGEEFGGLLVKTNATSGRQIAERLRKVVEGLILPTEKGLVRFTISIGGVAFSGSHHSLEYRLRQADAALYEAKSGGRNRVVLVEDFPKEPGQTETSQAGFFRLEWSQDYECGNRKIDSQHRNLFQLVNTLLTSMISGQDKENCQNLINTLLVEVSSHFSVEEHIIDTLYPLADDHRQIHKELLEKAELLAQNFHRGQLEFAEVFQFLAIEVVNKHMLNEDRKFFAYLPQKDISPHANAGKRGGVKKK